MARLLIIGGFLAVVFWVFSVVDCAVQPATRHRGVSKRTWLAIVILLPVLGGVLWFVLGRGRRGRLAARGPLAPDDDPAFLRSLDSRSEQDARIAELEAELARLDAEEDAAREEHPEHPERTEEAGRADGSAREGERSREGDRRAEGDGTAADPRS